MAYETKVVLTAIARLIKSRSDNKDDKKPYMELYKDLQAMANTEGVILEPFDEEPSKG